MVKEHCIKDGTLSEAVGFTIEVYEKKMVHAALFLAMVYDVQHSFYQVMTIKSAPRLPPNPLLN